MGRLQALHRPGREHWPYTYAAEAKVAKTEPRSRAKQFDPNNSCSLASVRPLAAKGKSQNGGTLCTSVNITDMEVNRQHALLVSWKGRSSSELEDAPVGGSERSPLAQSPASPN